jgi:hypothetical protein
MGRVGSGRLGSDWSLDMIPESDQLLSGGKGFPGGKNNSFPAGWERIS